MHRRDEETLNGTALAQAILVCIAGAVLESVAAGKSPRAYLAGLVLPRGSPPFVLWIAIGIAYYAICAILLYRLLALGPETILERAALALLLLLMAVNAFWNYLFFRRQSPRAGYLAFWPYSLLALVLGSVLFLADRGGVWILLPYLGYLIYALWWSRAFYAASRGLSRNPHAEQDRGRGRRPALPGLSAMAPLRSGATREGTRRSRAGLHVASGAWRPAHTESRFTEHGVAQRKLPRLRGLHGDGILRRGVGPAGKPGFRATHRGHVRRGAVVAVSPGADCRCAPLVPV
jgi:benzodiazapine receptor